MEVSCSLRLFGLHSSEELVKGLPGPRSHQARQLLLDLLVREVKLQAMGGLADLRSGLVAKLHKRGPVLALGNLHHELEHCQVILPDGHLTTVLKEDLRVERCLLPDQCDHFSNLGV